MTKKMVAYNSLRRTFLKLHPVCQCCQSKPSQHVHHTHGRAGQLLLHVPLWKSLCDGCHRKTHDQIEWARAQGLICEKGQWNKMP